MALSIMPVSMADPHVVNAGLAFQFDKPLKQIFQDLHERIVAAISGNRSHLAMETSGQICFAIVSIENFCKEELQQTVKLTHRIVLAALLEFDALIKDMEARNEAGLHSTADRIALVINPLILAKRSPIVTSTFPNYIIGTSSDKSVKLQINGYFPQNDSSIFAFSLHENTYRPTESSHAQVSFEIPTDQITSSKKAQIVVGNLYIQQKSWAGLRTNLYHYQIPIGILPSHPGSLAIEHIQQIAKREINHKIGPFVVVSSTRGTGGIDRNQRFELRATPGWKVLKGSHQVAIDKKKGDVSLACEEENDLFVAYRAKTRHSRDRQKAGQLRFTISFQEYRDDQVKEVPKKDLIALKWGESCAFEYPSGTWKVIFTPFDQPSTFEFVQPTEDDPFIKISSDDHCLNISAREPGRIKTPSFIKSIYPTQGLFPPPIKSKL